MKYFILSIPLIYTLSAYAEPITFSDYKFLDRGMSQAEVYLRVGEPDYIVPTEESKMVTKYNNNKKVIRYHIKSDAVWYGSSSIPVTIITFNNGKLENKTRSRAKAYFQKRNESMTLIDPK